MVVPIAITNLIVVEVLARTLFKESKVLKVEIKMEQTFLAMLKVSKLPRASIIAIIEVIDFKQQVLKQDQAIVVIVVE